MALIEYTSLVTLDRPFGIHWWSILNKAFTIIVGSPATDFEFIPHKTTLSTIKESSTLIALYIAVIVGGQELMRNRPAFKLKSAFLLHNLFLTIASLVLLVLFLEQIVPTVARHGFFYSICRVDGGWTQRLEVIYYLTYLSKYIELLDTCFLMLKKKPLTFLHCYHHAATAIFTLMGMKSATPVSWVVASLNLAVHIIMYWYYFQSARGIRVWWKEWITRLQILQFIIDLGFVVFVSYSYYTALYLPWMPRVGSCVADSQIAIAAFTICDVLILYLV